MFVRKIVVLVAMLLVVAGQVQAAQAALPKPPTYLVGAASRTINPDADGTFAGQPVYLGGYGIGGGSPVFQGRPATGILGEGLSVRAFAVSDGRRPFVIADIEAQGWFVALKNGPWGLLDMRKEVERRTGGALPAESVVIQSDHSHSGPDALGVWGGVPDEYLRYVSERTVEAIVAAYSSMEPAQLYYGTAPGRDLLSNQFDYDEANKGVDSDVRVLQARSPKSKKPLVTLLNFSAHTTVLGSSNTKVSGDWVQAANPLLEQRFGGKGVTVVATLGRTQPSDRSCADPAAVTAEAQDLCKIRDYAARVVERAAQAAANAQPLNGLASVAARSYLVEDVSTNALILGMAYAGDPIGVPLMRAMTPPWLAGNVLGTVTATCADRRRAAVVRAGRDVPADRGEGGGAGRRPRPHDGRAGERPARVPDRSLRGVSGAGPALVLQPGGRRGLADRQRQLLLQRVADDGRARDVLAAARRRRDGRARPGLLAGVRPLRDVRQRRGAAARRGRERALATRLPEPFRPLRLRRSWPAARPSPRRSPRATCPRRPARSSAWRGTSGPSGP